MFKKTKLAAALTASMIGTLGVMSSAQAVNISDDQEGQVLIFPYYNVNNGFQTAINLINTTNLYKAVKVRFRESKNSNDVLDFNVYMSPNDMWTATVRLNAATGKANVITSDETCTYPAKSLLQAGVDFIDGYDSVSVADVREGYIEVIEMGVIADGAGPAIDGVQEAEIDATGVANGVVNVVAGDRSIVAGLTHDSNGVPADCSVVADAWGASAGSTIINGFARGVMAGGVGVNATNALPYADIQNAGLVAPTGGLMGNSILLDTNTGAAFVAEPATVEAYASVPQHYRSDDTTNYLLPSLASGDVQVADVPTDTGVPVAGCVAFNKLMTPVAFGLTFADWGSFDTDLAPNASIASGQNPFPMAYALSANSVINQFLVDPAFSASTDWVITNPMKKHGIWADKILVSDTDTTDAVVFPASIGLVAYSATGNSTYTAVANFTGGDIQYTMTDYDREEQIFVPTPGSPGFSPVFGTTTPIFRLPNEVNILAFLNEFGTNQPVLGTDPANILTHTLQGGIVSGWAQMNFDARYNYVAETVAPAFPAAGPTAGVYGEYASAVPAGLPTITGVPAMGFAAIAASVGGDTVGETFPHNTVSNDR